MNNEAVAGKRMPSPGSCLHEPAWTNLKLVRRHESRQHITALKILTHE